MRSIQSLATDPCRKGQRPLRRLQIRRTGRPTQSSKRHKQVRFYTRRSRSKARILSSRTRTRSISPTRLVLFRNIWFQWQQPLHQSPTIDSKTVFSGKWEGFTGSATQISDVYGDTSGRFGVAKTIARVFPAHMGFIRKVIAEGIESAKDFPQGPYPNDKLTYRSKEIVEYQTPANTKGLGTDSRLKENSSPIDGVAMLVSEEPNFEEPSLIFLAVRLPPDQADLTHVIIQQTEQEIMKHQ
jgi:hypothetical protein